MKFRDGELDQQQVHTIGLSLKLLRGMWLPAEGKRIEYAEEIYSVMPLKDGKKISLLCPTTQIRSRGDTLNKPTITMVNAHRDNISHCRCES